MRFTVEACREIFYNVADQAARVTAETEVGLARRLTSGFQAGGEDYQSGYRCLSGAPTEGIAVTKRKLLKNGKS